MGVCESGTSLSRERNSDVATGDGSQSRPERVRDLRSSNSPRAPSRTTPRLTRSSIEENDKVNDDVEELLPRNSSSAAGRRLVAARGAMEVAASSPWPMSEDDHLTSSGGISQGTTRRTRPTATFLSSVSVSYNPTPSVGRAARLPAAPRFGPWLTRRSSSSRGLAGNLPWQSPAESIRQRASQIDRTRVAGRQRVGRISSVGNTRTAQYPVATGSNTVRHQGITRNKEEEKDQDEQEEEDEKEEEGDEEEEEGDEEEELEFDWRVGGVSSGNKRRLATEPEEDKGEEQENEFDWLIAGASPQMKEYQTKEKNETGTDGTEDSGPTLPNAGRASGSRLLQGRHRKLATTNATGSGVNVGRGSDRRRLCRAAGDAETTVTSSSSQALFPATSPPSPTTRRGFGFRGRHLQRGTETEEIGLETRLVRYREGPSSSTGSDNTLSGDLPVVANAGALCESDDDESSSVGRVAGDNRGATMKEKNRDSDDGAFLRDSEDDESSAERVGGELPGSAGEGRAVCERRRGRRGSQNGRGGSSNVSSAQMSSCVSVGLFDRFRFACART